MIGYYIRLALEGFRRNPGLTAVMVGAVALGIAVCVVTITVYHAMSGNPIWWKNDRLYAVTMNLGDPDMAPDPRHPDMPPPQLSYRDAMFLASSSIPERHVVMFKQGGGVLTGGPGQPHPVSAPTRITTADFFQMFDVPFLYGGGWTADADRSAAPVLVLSKHENEALFGGKNSVGKTIRWNDRVFRIVGVLDDWFPIPKFFDLTNSPFEPPEDVYLPFGWTNVLEGEETGGSVDCWGPIHFHSFTDFLNSDCVWLQMWVELPSAASRVRFQAYMDAYWQEQHRAGRFLRREDNRLTNVGRWLVDNDVVLTDNRLLVGIAFAFFVVCLTNTVGLLLAKFIGRAPLNGVRRALGARRREIFVQHLVEIALLCVAGALAGLGLAALGLQAVHALYAESGRGGYQELAHFDVSSVVAALVLTLLAAAAAGLYPAWRVGRTPPASYLKTQ